MGDPRDLNNRGIHSLDLAKHCVLTQAIAAVDIALWDALGKSLRQPVNKLLGGFRDRIPVIAIGGYLREGDSFVDLETEIVRYKEEQIFGIKMKVGKLSVEEDIERARIARKAGGPNFHLCTDSNQAWTVEEAMKFARGVRDLNIAWLEEPVRWHDQIEGNARVRAVGIPVNAGQGEISRHGCRDLIARGAVDIINVDATIAAGVTEWRRVGLVWLARLASPWRITRSLRWPSTSWPAWPMGSAWRFFPITPAIQCGSTFRWSAP